MPFYTYKSNISYINISDYFSIQNFLFNNIYSYIIIGSPPQKIVANINFNDYRFNIYNNQCDIPSEYNYFTKNSSTRINKGFILTDVYVDTFLMEDIFYLPQYHNKSLKLNYIYAPMNDNMYEPSIKKKKYTCANIGLKLSVDYVETLNYNFLRELKSLGIIDSYVFFLYYNDTSKDEGELIIGELPHEVNKNIYKYSQYKEVYASNNKYMLCWMLRFDKFNLEYNSSNNLVYYNLTDNIEAEIDYNLNVIYGSEEFLQLIDQIYFNKAKEDNLCEKIYINYHNIIYYECKSSLDIRTFPKISFIHKELASKFTLSYQEVFALHKNKYIFLIWFERNENRNVWKLGKPFLKKYIFTFNLDKKTIGYYSGETNSSRIISKNEQDITIKFTIIKLILLSIIAFILCYFITKLYYRQKKHYKNDEKLTELIYMNK